MLLVNRATFIDERYRFLGNTLENLHIMAPLIVPHVVSALAYYGFLGGVRLTGTHLGVIVAHGVLAVPVAFLVISASLKGFDRNLERAAMSAGAGPFRTFFHVTLPVLRPGMLVGALFAFLSSFNEAVVALFIAGRAAAGPCTSSGPAWWWARCARSCPRSARRWWRCSSPAARPPPCPSRCAGASGSNPIP